MSPGHIGRGITYLHAHRERKPPLDKVDIFACSYFLPVSPLGIGEETADLF